MKTNRREHAMTQTTFEVDDATLAALTDLKKKFGVKTNAQVIRKALALARVAAQNVGEDNTITILSPDQHKQKVLLSV
jgi:hypothetical protein